HLFRWQVYGGFVALDRSKYGITPRGKLLASPRSVPAVSRYEPRPASTKQRCAPVSFTALVRPQARQQGRRTPAVRIRCDAREMLPPLFSGCVQYAAPIGYSRCTCRRQTESGLRLDRTSGGGAADRGLNLSSLQ